MRYLRGQMAKSALLSSGKKKWLREYSDKAQVLAWQAKEKSFDAMQAAKAREKRESSDSSALEEALKPIARAYSALPYPQRLAFEVWVLSTIKKGA